MIDRQDVTGPETLRAPLLGLVPDVAARASEKTLNTPTDRSDRSDRVIRIQILIIKHGGSTAEARLERRGRVERGEGYTISGMKRSDTVGRRD